MIHILYIQSDDGAYHALDEIVDSLSNMEISLTRATSDDDALKAVCQSNVDIVFVGDQDGGSSGIDFVQSMRKVGCEIPMIILSKEQRVFVDQPNTNLASCHYLDQNALSAGVIERTIEYCCRNQCDTKIDDLIDNEEYHQESSFPNILLVEDDEDDYLIARELLIEIYGKQLQLRWLRSAEEAQRAVHNERFDVVIVDFHLSGQNGLELVKQSIRAEVDCPFIVLTGDSNRETDIAALQAGATDYLVKSEITPTLMDRAIRYSIERFRSEKRLAELAKFDQLTGLANRYLFHEFMDNEISRNTSGGSNFALLLIDLDRFKQINDTHGHSIGDSLLQAVAKRISRLVRASDLVARLGGDEFIVVITDIQSRDEVHKKAAKISEVLHEPLNIAGTRLEPGASIGLSIFPHDGRSAEELIVSADAAMYTAKQNPPLRIGLYTPEMRKTTNRRLSLERTMKFAVEASQFHLRFQPKYDIAKEEIFGFEALLRWRHPEMGEISPSEFVGIAEANGAILAIGDWVVVSACAQLAKWRELGLPELSVAVNVSARQLCDPELPGRVSDVLDMYQISPDRLEIEITEGDMMRNPEQSYRLLREFRDIGIGVALDDFGTGYSSLIHLRDFPGTIIKIDKKFIANIDQNQRDSSIVEALISVAHKMDMKIVAEGIENEKQLEYLKQLNCDFLQGYLISEPLQAIEIDKSFQFCRKHSNMVPLD